MTDLGQRWLTNHAYPWLEKRHLNAIGARCGRCHTEFREIRGEESNVRLGRWHRFINWHHDHCKQLRLPW